jgi:predicted ferric reductase
VVTLVLLTVTAALGVANFKRFRTRRIPRFVIDGVHRNAALLAVAFLAIHILTSLADAYVQVNLVNVFIPFGAGYRPFWLGLGAVSLDLLAAVVVTSLLRRHIGHRAWRATHWLAYASWPVALAHSLGAGSDAGSGWMLWLAAACTLTVAAAILVRRADPAGAPSRQPTTQRERRRRAAAALSAAAPGR